MTTRNVQFTSAFCFEVQHNLNIYEARDYFWDSTNKYYDSELTYKCPDVNCSASFTGVGIKPEKPIMRAMHFRVKVGYKHDVNCQFTNIINSSQLTHLEKTHKINQSLNPIPTHFILKTHNASINASQIVDNKHIQENENGLPTKKLVSNTSSDNLNTTHQTSQLERLVNVFTTYSPKFLKSNGHLLSLNGYRDRWFYNCFKPIRYFNEEEQYIPFIYYGQILNVVQIDTGYYIYFVNKIKNDSLYLPVSIFISNDNIQQYSKKKQLYIFLKLIPQQSSIATAYFVDSCPTLIHTAKNTKIYSINLNHLNQLWIEWDK